MDFNVSAEDRFKNGVYAISNKLDSRKYIGSTTQGFLYRYKVHLDGLKKNRHKNTYLQNFANKYGAEKLVFEILEIVEGTDKVLEREQAWIDKYWGTGLLFNVAKDAKAPMLGRKHTEEDLVKMRGRKHTETELEKMRGLGTWNIGRKVSEKTREKFRNRKSFLGKAHSDEAKEKISLANKGRTRTEEQKRKISERMKAYWLEERRKKNVETT